MGGRIDMQRVFGAPAEYGVFTTFGSLLDKSADAEYGQTYRFPKGFHSNVDGTIMLRKPGASTFTPFVVYGGQYYPYTFDMIGSTTAAGTTSVTSVVAFWG